MSETCKLCGKPRQSWQVFCGAACCAGWEMGMRPKDLEAEMQIEAEAKEA